MMENVLVIAEVGVNHNGSLDTARRLVDAAADAGADVVKFQTFKASALVSRHAAKADYQKRTVGDDGGQLELLKALELDEAAHRTLQAHCRDVNIGFLSTPFDPDSARLLIDLGLERVKVSSGDLTNAPLLHQLARSGVDLILSSGMALLSDIETALGVIAHGYTVGDAPSKEACRAAYISPGGQVALRERVSLLHCTTEYPAPFESVNLRAMETLAAAFGLRTGYSDHTEGLAISLAAAARGAQLLEKHITLDRAMPGPDHAASIEPEELKTLVTGVRAIEAALGSPRKLTVAVEERNRQIATKSLVALTPVRAGDILTTENIGPKRPMGGRPPIDLWELVGRPAPRDYDQDDPITL